METLEGGTTSPINGTNEISQNGQKFSIKFQKMRQSTWNGTIKSLKIGEVLDLIKKDWRISSNWPIVLIKRRRSSREVLELIKRNRTINLDGKIGSLGSRGQLAWYGQSEHLNAEGSHNMALGELEASRVFLRNRISWFHRVVLLIPIS